MKTIDLTMEAQVPAFWYKKRKEIVGADMCMGTKKNAVGTITKIVRKKGKTYCLFKIKNKKALQKIMKHSSNPVSFERIG